MGAGKTVTLAMWIYCRVLEHCGHDREIGVTAPGSSTNVMANFVLAKAGLKPSDVSIIGVGAGNGAVAAMRSGQIDAISLPGRDSLSECADIDDACGTVPIRFKLPNK